MMKLNILILRIRFSKKIEKFKFINLNIYILQNMAHFNIPDFKIQSNNNNIVKKSKHDYTIDDEYPLDIQPKFVKIYLKPHQLKSLRRMKLMENNQINLTKDNVEHNFQNNEIKINTRFGILADKVGSGKSYIILSLISDKKYLDFNIENIYSSQHSLITIKKNIIENELGILYIKSNILVIPHSLLKQWQGYIDNITNINPFYIKTKKNIEEYWDTSVMDNTIDLIVIISTRLRDFYSSKSNYDTKNCLTSYFSRIIYDEADSINISLIPYINSLFTWFMTGSINNLLNPHGSYNYINNPNGWGYKTEKINGVHNTGFIKDFMIHLGHSHKYINTFIVKNNEETVDQLLALPQPIFTDIICKKTQELNILGDILDKNVIELLQMGDMKKAMESLNLEMVDEDNIIKLTNKKLLNELENLQIEREGKIKMNYSSTNSKLEAIQKMDNKINEVQNKIDKIKERIMGSDLDPIMMTEIENPVITPCCNNKFDFESISLWYKEAKDKECPMCRKPLHLNKLIYLVDKSKIKQTNEIIEKSKINEKKKLTYNYEENFKEDNIIYVLKKNIMKRKHKILVFSNSDESFNIITNKMKDLKHKHLKGTSSHIANVLNEFKNSDLNILFMNAKYFGAGLNIENATDIIFYHEMDKDLETQIIGRAQRMGRVGQLNIWKFKY
jgi:hypothetical protein